MGFSSPTKAPYVLGAMALLVVFLSASQDIVIDAYRVDTIPASERGLAAAATAFGYRTASMLAGAVLVLIAAHTGLAPGFSGHRRAHGGDHAVAHSGRRSRRRRASPRRPWPTRYGIRCANLFSQKGAWGFLLLVLLYKAGDAFALSLYSAFMIKGVGFSLDELSIAGKANMTISTMIGVTLGGWIYMRWGMFRSLLVFGIGQALTNLLYMCWRWPARRSG